MKTGYIVSPLASVRSGFAGVFVFLFVLLLFSGVNLGAQTVNFPDPYLEAAVRNTLPKPSGDITEEDMLTLDHLYVSDHGISDTSGLEYARNLTDLDFSRNPVANFSGFAGLTNLETLTWIWSPLDDLAFVTNLVNLRRAVIYGNQFQDISPVASLLRLELLQLDWNPAVTNLTLVAAMTNLTHLSLAGDGVTNAAFLTGLARLQELSLYLNDVKDIVPLAGLSDLTMLSLGWNNITNPAVLAAFTGLEELWLNGNALTNVPYLAGLTSLRRLGLDYTDLTDMAPLTNLTLLTELNVGENYLTSLPDLSALTSLRVFMMAGNQITDLAPVTNLTALLELHAQRNLFASVAPLSGCPWLERLLLSGNSLADLAELSVFTNLHYLQLREMQISSLDFVAPLTGLNDLDIGDNRVTDLSPLTHLPDLHYLSGDRNRLTQIEPLLDCPSLWYVNLLENYLDLYETSAAWSVITNLEYRGVLVDYAPQLMPPVLPHVLVQPANGSAFPGNEARFSVTVEAAEFPPEFRWQKDGVDLENDARIYGADSDTLTIQNIDAADAGLYSVRVWRDWVATKSLAAELKVITEVAFADPNLEEAVRAQLGIYEEPLTPEDLMGMTYLYASHTYWAITNLSGLEAAADLEELDLGGQFSLQSFAPLTFLTRLSRLYLNQCGLDSLEFLAGLHPLAALSVSGNFIEDLSPLSRQPGLEFLYLDDNQLTQIDPLSDLSVLYEVYLQYNRLDTNETSAAWNVVAGLETRGVYVEFDPQNAAADRPVIMLQPVNVAAYAGDDISFRVEAAGSGSGLSFRWLKNGGNLADAGTLYGADGDTLYIDDVVPADAGSYRVRVWDENGMTNSCTVTLRVVADVAFADPQLEQAVRDLIGKPAGELTPADLGSVTMLDAANYGITNLAGIEAAVNLEWISLSYNLGIADFTPLTLLPKLNVLDLNGCGVSDIAFVADLPPLRELHVWQGSITDISALAGQTALERLNLAYSAGITSFAVLSSLTNLYDLWLEGTGVSNISFAAHMPRLHGLSVEAGNVGDLSPLAGATNLAWLDMANNQVTNAAPLAGCTRLEWLSAGNNRIADLGFVTPLTRLTFLSLGQNAIEDLAPLAGLTLLDFLDIGWNPLTNAAPIGTLAALSDLRIANAGLAGDLGFLATLTNLQVLDASLNAITAFPSYPGLSRLRYLNLDQNPLENLGFVASLPNLEQLFLNSTGIQDLSPLAGRTNLRSLGLYFNGITSLAPLATLTGLEWLSLMDNQVQDISALAGLVNLTYVDLRYNRLDVNPGSATVTVIATLESRGARVDYLPQREEPVPIVLSAPAWLGGNQFQFTITSAPDAVLEIWSSTNLTSWSSAGFVTNTSGITTFTDPAAADDRQFYRAQQQ